MGTTRYILLAGRVVLLSAVLVTSVQRNSNAETHAYDPAQQYTGLYVFDQSNVLPKSMAMPKDDLDQKLVHQYRFRKYWPIYKNAALGIGLGAIVLAGEIFCLPWFLGTIGRFVQPSTEALTTPALKLRSLLGDLVGTMAYSKWPLVAATLWRAGPKVWGVCRPLWEKKSSILDELAHAYVTCKRFMPEKLQEQVEHQFKLVQGMPENLKAIEFIRQAVTLPFIHKPINFSEKRVRQSLYTYHSGVVNEVVEYCKTYFMNTHKRIRGLYIYGPQGTGKTLLVTLLGKTMGANVTRLSLGQMTLKDFFGDVDKNAPNASPGRFLEKLQELGSANGILVLEDIDRFLHQNPDALAPFLELFDWGNKSFYNQYFGINFNIEGLIIVLTGNTPLSDMALADRLWLIKMPQYEYEHKIKIVWNYIVPNLLLNNPHRQRIQRLLPAHKVQIEEYLKLDKNPGFRTIEKLLTRYLNYLDRLSVSPNTPPPDLRNFITVSNEELEHQERLVSKI